MYNKTTKWSIRLANDGIVLFLYPRESRLIQQLASIEGDEWSVIPYVAYKDAEIGTKEAKNSFQELLNIVKEKVYGVDDILDAIIDDDIPY